MNELNDYDETNPNNKFQKKKRDFQDKNQVHRFQKTCGKHIGIVDTARKVSAHTHENTNEHHSMFERMGQTTSK